MAHVQISDALLIQDYITGNEQALSCLIERHQSKIYSFIYSKVLDRDVADDLFQDTFIKVIKTLKTKSYNEEGKFLPWVMRIAHNIVIDYFRSCKKMSFNRDSNDYSVFSLMSNNELNAEDLLIDFQIQVDLEKIVLELPEDQREVVMMRIYQDLSFKEISEITGVSINTALGRMRYAVINMRKVVEKNKIILTN